jgi:hypothetical protein
VAIVNEDSYQSFCSDILDYTTPLTTAYQTATATAVVTASTTTTVTNFVATVTVTTVQAPAAKRQETTADATPTPLTSYPDDYITSACRLAVTSPSTSTISSTVTVTGTQTNVQVATQTVQATATATKVCAKYPITNSGFETGSFNPWQVYNPINGAGGSWSLQAGQDSARGAYVAQVTLLNPDTTKYGGFLGEVYQTINTCVGFSYTVTFDWRCTVVDNGLAMYGWVYQSSNNVGNSGQINCGSANTWNSASMTFTSTSTTAQVYIEGVQNGVTQGVMQFDNIVATLNQ